MLGRQPWGTGRRFLDPWNCFGFALQNRFGAVGSLEVKTGRHLLLDRSKEDPSLTFADLLRRGHDSVLMDRGVCMKGPHKGKKAGNEWIVYSWDQVQVLKEVPRDPVP